MPDLEQVIKEIIRHKPMTKKNRLPKKKRRIKVTTIKIKCLGGTEKNGDLTTGNLEGK